jgi:hypothetical protein
MVHDDELLAKRTDRSDRVCDQVAVPLPVPQQRLQQVLAQRQRAAEQRVAARAGKP